MSDVYHEATVSYDGAAISILDRNIHRIARDHDWGQAIIPTEGVVHNRPKRFTYLFKTNRKRQQFIQEMQKFLSTADFGVTVSVEDGS